MQTLRKHNLLIAANLLNQNFNPTALNRFYISDITYLRAQEGWLSLAIVRDLFNREVIGSSLSARMATAIKEALTMASLAADPQQVSCIVRPKAGLDANDDCQNKLEQWHDLLHDSLWQLLG